MEGYKQILDTVSQQISAVERFLDGAFIPFDPMNTDYQKFKTDVLDGAELQDVDGNPMTQAEATAFIETLP